MKQKLSVIIGTIIALLCISTASIAQESDEKIVVNISKQHNGEKQTFEKTYSSLDEMRSDEEYMAFAGQDQNTWISIGEGLDKEITINIDHDNEKFVFSGIGDENLKVMGFSNLKDEMMQMEVQIKKAMDDETFSKISKMAREIDRTGSLDYTEATISIEDPVKSDFGKSALPSKDEALSSASLKLKVLGDQLIIKFPLEKAEDVRVSLADHSGEEVFVNKISHAQHDIHQILDLSQHRDGIYLLEIKVGQQRLTKKVTVKRKE